MDGVVCECMTKRQESYFGSIENKWQMIPAMSAFRDEKHENMFLSSSDLNLPSPIQSIRTYKHKNTPWNVLRNATLTQTRAHSYQPCPWIINHLLVRQRRRERERQLCPWSGTAHKIVTLIEAAGGQIVKNPKVCSAGGNHRAAVVRHTLREREIERAQRTVLFF